MFTYTQKPTKSAVTPARGVLQRKCDSCHKKMSILQRSTFGSAPEMAPPTGHGGQRSSEWPPDPATRTFMEPRLGHDLSKIPVYPRSSARIQAKLIINAPGDVYEQEADRIANQVLAKAAHHVVSGVPPHIQRLSGQPAGQPGMAPASVDQALATPGKPLEPTLRKDMEQRFGHDFSRVRVHSGAAAEQSAKDVNANAYTVGHNMVFGAGRFAPETNEGRRLIAHELTHVVQQSQATAGRQLSMGRSGDLAECEAGATARAVLAGQRIPALTPTGRSLARSPGDSETPPLRSQGLTAAEWDKIMAARKYFALPARPTSSKTNIVGILILEDGEEIRIKSGEGGPQGGTEIGGIPRGKGERFTGGGSSQGNIATHVEGKAAAIMHQRKISKATLLVEEMPCRVCDNPHGTPGITQALPPGSKLTVVDPTATGHYSGSQLPGVGAAPAAPATPTKTPPTTRSQLVENKPTPTMPSTPVSSTVVSGGNKPPVVSAKELAAESVRKELEIKRMTQVVRAVNYFFFAWNAYNVLMDALKARGMAYSIVAEGTPYWKEIKQAQEAEERAAEVEQYYASLNVLENQMPSKGDPVWDDLHRLLEIQASYVLMEGHLYNALISIKSARCQLAGHCDAKSIAKVMEDTGEKLFPTMQAATQGGQIGQLRDVMAEKTGALVFSITSLPYADVTFFAEAGGKMNRSLLGALDHYTSAQTWVEHHGRMARAAIKTLELRLREIGQPSAFFGDMSDSEVRSSSLDRFTIYGDR